MENTEATPSYFQQYLEETPHIKWIKNDPKKHAWFQDGSVFLVALRTRIKNGPLTWKYETIRVDCDGDDFTLLTNECHCTYDSWQWRDFEYFALLEGEVPTERP